MSNEPSGTNKRFSATVSRYLGTIDKVLAAGRVAQARVDRFYQAHGLQPGFGEKALTSEKQPPARRTRHQRLLALQAELYRQKVPVNQPRPRVSASAAARALGNPHRI
jgi:hypothetical protein